MKIGTKSILFGVHQFIYHPLTIALAWRKLYGKWPNWIAVISIFFHDWGYWGCPNMDGPEGQEHPVRGAQISKCIAYLISRFLLFRSDYSARRQGNMAYWYCLGHSRYHAAKAKLLLSPLFLPDKMSVLFDPPWFYLLRARLSGELVEYMANAPLQVSGRGPAHWYLWYRLKISDMENNYTCAGELPKLPKCT